MNKELEELIQHIEDYEAFDIPDDFFDKVEGEILPGASVKVYWSDRENCDKGYLFTLPGQSHDEGDVFVHIPQMDNSDGIGNGEEIHIHLFKILYNERVRKVVIKGGFL